MGVFHGPESARRELFPAHTRAVSDTFRLEGPRRDIAAAYFKTGFTESAAVFERVYGGDSLLGYLYAAREIGKVEYLDFIVALDTRGNVSRVLVTAYRESVGGEVSSKRFLRQYRGKNARHRLRLHREVDAITGATLSSRAVTTGVRKALSFWEACYGRT
jgi:Na+-translocating ferredoxin:NAD+ oxidoreductase RnfG subunit